MRSGTGSSNKCTYTSLRSSRNQLAKKLADYRAKMVEEVEKKAARVEQQLG